MPTAHSPPVTTGKDDRRRPAKRCRRRRSSRRPANPRPAPSGHAAAFGGPEGARGATPCPWPRQTAFVRLPADQAARNRSAASLRQRKHGRWPAASAVASSRKNNSVQLRPPMTSRRTPLKSHEQTSHVFVAQRLDRRVRVAGSWMMPRLPVNRPRSGIAMISPNGVTRFCSDMDHLVRSINAIAAAGFFTL
jgi:hypothetical protein